MMITYIYALVDPRTNEIRYVGKTKRKLTSRYKEHCNTDGWTDCAIWIKELRCEGLLPLIEVLEECNESNWSKQEKYWKTYGDEHGWPLTNMTDGGEDGVQSEKAREKMKLAWETREPVSEETKKKKSIANIIRFQDPNERKKISDSGKERYKDPEERRKTSEAMKKRLEDPTNHPMYGKHHTIETKKKKSEIGKLRYLDQAEHDKQSETMKKLYENNPELYKDISIANIIRFQDPNERKKISDAMKAYWEGKRNEKNQKDNTE